MNNIDKNIFSSYASVETALLNDLATEARTKGKKARVLKGEGYYVKYDGVEYDITSEQSRMYNLIRNNYNHFVEQLNSARADILGVWKAVWEDELPRIIANLEKGIEICQKYFDAFKAYITEGVEENAVEEEEVEMTEEVTAEVTEVEKNDESVETVEKTAEVTESEVNVEKEVDKNIFSSYETVETALLNDLATEARTKGKKARALKGFGYYVMYDGVRYDITPEQCRIYKLIRNNFDMFAEHLNLAESDVLGFWAAMCGDRLPSIIAKTQIGLEICQEYFNAFKAFITEGVGEDEVEETVEEVEKNEKNDEVSTEKNVVAAEKNAEVTEEAKNDETESNDECETPAAEYKLIEGFEDYMVSSDGKVWSLNYGRTGKMKELKPETTKKGYLQVHLCSNGQNAMKYVHRLVAQAFIENPDNKPQVNHEDEVKTNNSVENLKWCDANYNNNFGTHNERVAKAHINHPALSTPVVCVETGEVYPSVSEASRQTCVNLGDISSCLNGKLKTAGGFHWARFIEGDNPIYD